MTSAATYQKPAFSIWRALGFGTCVAPRMEEFDEDTRFAPARFQTDTIIVLDWKDRLRVLVSGKVMCTVSTKTAVAVPPGAISHSAISVLPPYFKPAPRYFEHQPITNPRSPA